MSDDEVDGVRNMEQALTWIGFTNDANRASLRIDIS